MEQASVIMENYKMNLASNLINGNYSLSVAQQKAQDGISSMIEYAWNNWDDSIVATYFTGPKPRFANAGFIENWLDNEDFEADGFDVNNLKDLFSDK